MRARRVLRWYGMRVGILIGLAASLLVVPAVSRGEYFGGTPLSDVEYWANQSEQCDLDQMELAALMIAQNASFDAQLRDGLTVERISPPTRLSCEAQPTTR